MEIQAGEYNKLIKEVLDAYLETISNADNLRLYQREQQIFLRIPNCSDSAKASELIYTLQNKRELVPLLLDQKMTMLLKTMVFRYI